MPENPTASTSQTLGAKQLAIYLTERGVDPKSIPAEALKEIVLTASEAIELDSIRNSQALVMYMGLLKTYSVVIADYCKNGTTSDRVICEILKTHGVLSGPL